MRLPDIMRQTPKDLSSSSHEPCRHPERHINMLWLCQPWNTRTTFFWGQPIFMINDIISSYPHGRKNIYHYLSNKWAWISLPIIIYPISIQNLKKTWIYPYPDFMLWLVGYVGSPEASDDLDLRIPRFFRIEEVATKSYLRFFYVFLANYSCIPHALHRFYWIYSAWWFQPTPLKNDGVRQDDDIPNIWKKNHVPNHQSETVSIIRSSHLDDTYECCYSFLGKDDGKNKQVCQVLNSAKNPDR